MSAATDPPRRASFIDANDDQRSTFGDADDVSVGYDSGQDAYTVHDEAASLDVARFEAGGTGDLNIPNGQVAITSGSIGKPNLRVEAGTADNVVVTRYDIDGAAARIVWNDAADATIRWQRHTNGATQAFAVFNEGTSSTLLDVQEGGSVLVPSGPVNLQGGDLQRNGTTVVTTQQSAIASLTNNMTSTTTDGALESIPDTTTNNASQEIERNFTELNAKVDALISRLESHGLIAV